MYPSLLCSAPDGLGRNQLPRSTREPAPATPGPPATRRAVSLGERQRRHGTDSAAFARTAHVRAAHHLDIALAQWQFFLATGDQTWLEPAAGRCSEAARLLGRPCGPGRRRELPHRHVTAPTSITSDVDDEVYTNVRAAITRRMRLATQAATLLGKQPQPRRGGSPTGCGLSCWTRKAARTEYGRSSRGYTGDLVEQADVVHADLPVGMEQESQTIGLSTTSTTTKRATDPDGPAMTDSSIAIDSLRRSASPAARPTTLTQRSVKPFVQPPFDQFTEVRAAARARSRS